jgi:hypothetical protein
MRGEPEVLQQLKSVICDFQMIEPLTATSASHIVGLLNVVEDFSRHRKDLKFVYNNIIFMNKIAIYGRSDLMKN